MSNYLCRQGRMSIHVHMIISLYDYSASTVHERTVSGIKFIPFIPL